MANHIVPYYLDQDFALGKRMFSLVVSNVHVCAVCDSYSLSLRAMAHQEGKYNELMHSHHMPKCIQILAFPQHTAHTSHTHSRALQLSRRSFHALFAAVPSANTNYCSFIRLVLFNCRSAAARKT